MAEIETGAIRLYFQCDNQECPSLIEYEWDPTLLVQSGTPICEICEHDAEYIGWKKL